MGIKVYEIFEWPAYPALLHQSTQSGGKTLDNVLCEDFECLSILSIGKDSSNSDHHPILMQFDCGSCKIPIPSFSLVFIVNSAQQMTVFCNFWSSFSFLDHPARKVVGFDDQPDNSIFSSINKKRRKRWNVPFYYSSHFVHSLNFVTTLNSECIKKAAQNIFVRVRRTENDLSDSVKLDRLCFPNETATNSISECLEVDRLFSVQSLPQQMHCSKVKFCGEDSIATGCNMFFSDSFNTQIDETHGVSLQSERLVYHSELLNSKPELIYTLPVEVKQTTYDTLDNFPCKLLNWNINVLSTLFYPNFCSIFSFLKFPDDCRPTFVIQFFKVTWTNFHYDFWLSFRWLLRGSQSIW